MELYAAFVSYVRQALFWIGAVVAVIALVDWLVRTRRVNPFGPIPQFFRTYVDPLMKPIETRIVRAGGQPSSAPWWTLVVVVVGGLILISLLQFAYGMMQQVRYATETPGGAWRVLVMWTFGLFRIALIVRVVSTWVGMSPYSKWIRWTYSLTEWFLKPLRHILPAMGPIDVSPILAFLLLGLIESAIL